MHVSELPKINITARVAIKRSGIVVDEGRVTDSREGADQLRIKIKSLQKNTDEVWYGFFTEDFSGKSGWRQLHEDPFSGELCYSKRDSFFHQIEVVS